MTSNNFYLEGRMTYSRYCPQCGAEKIYKSEVRLAIALKANNPCKSCAAKRLHRENPNKMRGENNPMFGTSSVQMWRETLNPQQFKQRMAELRISMQSRSYGSKNPMFGKPSPIGSGRGISGRWQGLHFRSLLELAFLETFFNQHGYLPKTGETHNYKVSLPSGKNYFPDFIDNEENIYEIKPSRMLPLNEEKLIAGAQAFPQKFFVITEKELQNYNDIHLRLQAFTNLILNKRKKIILPCLSVQP